MDLSIVVMAHERRAHWFDYLKEELGDVPFVIDTDKLKLGTWGNCRRAWQTVDPKADYGLVIQDDAILCKGFVEKAKQFITEHNGHAIQFYFGNRHSTLHYLFNSQTKDDGYIVAPMNWGVAIALPQDHIQRMIAFGDDFDRSVPDDARIKHYCRASHLQTHYPWPSLVDHRPNQSLVGKYHKKNRIAVEFIDRKE
jgi:hypothetical protein